MKFYYQAKNYKLWKTGELPKKWFKLYHAIFDKENLNQALNQPNYHFYEWVAAINFYKRGYKSLVEQYVYKPHKRKLSVLKQTIGEVRFKKLLQMMSAESTQPPDLFVYNNHEHFFAEVKSPKDKYRDAQKLFFTKLKKELGIITKLVYLEEKID